MHTEHGSTNQGLAVLARLYEGAIYIVCLLVGHALCLRMTSRVLEVSLEDVQQKLKGLVSGTPQKSQERLI